MLDVNLNEISDGDLAFSAINGGTSLTLVTAVSVLVTSYLIGKIHGEMKRC